MEIIDWVLISGISFVISLVITMFFQSKMHKKVDYVIREMRKTSTDVCEKCGLNHEDHTMIQAKSCGILDELMNKTVGGKKDAKKRP